MPLISFDPLRNIRKLRQNFAAETGLPLLVYSHGEIAEDETILFSIQGKNYSNEWIKQQLKFRDTNYYLLDLRTRVSDFEENIRYLYGLEVKLFSREFHIPGRNESLINLVSDKHRSKISCPDKMAQLSRKYRLIEDDIYARLDTINARTYMMMSEEDYYTDYNVSANISYYYFGNRNNNPEIHTHEVFGMYHGDRSNNKQRILFPFRKDKSSFMLDHLRFDIGLTDYDITRINSYSIEIHSECQRLNLRFL